MQKKKKKKEENLENTGNPLPPPEIPLQCLLKLLLSFCPSGSLSPERYRCRRTSQITLSPYMESCFPISKVWEEISVFKQV